MKESARIDKWLWAARIYKTRSIAADACKNGRVMVGGVTRKPSFIIKRGDVVSVKKAPITYSFEVLDCIEQRVGAKMLYGVYKNVTDPKQYELLGDEPHQRFRRQSKRHWSPNQEGTSSPGCLRVSCHVWI